MSFKPIKKDEAAMDNNLTKYLQCDVELSFSGPSTAVINKWAADTLRNLVDRVEADEFEVGHHHPVKDRVGKPVGTVYIDCARRDDI